MKARDIGSQGLVALRVLGPEHGLLSRCHDTPQHSDCTAHERPLVVLDIGWHLAASLSEPCMSWAFSPLAALQDAGGKRPSPPKDKFQPQDFT